MELLRALASFAEPYADEHRRIAELLELPATPTEHLHTQVFVFNLYPYASVHLGAEGMLGGEARDRVAGFFRALDAIPPSDPDTLATLLAAYAQLAERGDADDPRARHAATTLLHEHLVPWLPLYLGRVAAQAPEPYRSWAQLTSQVLQREAVAFPATGDLLPLHLREAPPLEDPREDDATPLVRALLAPARCGFIVTTTDLRRAARDTGLGLRIGERRYVLEQLLGQAVPETLRWLAGHAATTAEAVAPWDELAPAVTGWWRGRADATTALLHELATEAEHATVVPVT